MEHSVLNGSVGAGGQMTAAARLFLSDAVTSICFRTIGEL